VVHFKSDLSSIRTRLEPTRRYILFGGAHRTHEHTFFISPIWKQNGTNRLSTYRGNLMISNSDIISLPLYISIYITYYICYYVNSNIRDSFAARASYRGTSEWGYLTPFYFLETGKYCGHLYVYIPKFFSQTLLKTTAVMCGGGGGSLTRR